MVRVLKAKLDLPAGTGETASETESPVQEGALVRERTLPPSREASMWEAEDAGGGVGATGVQAQRVPGSQRVLHAEEPKLTVKSGTEDSSSKGHKVKSEF